MHTRPLARNNLIRWRNGQQGGYGHVVAVDDAQRQVSVRLDSGEDFTFRLPSDQLERVRFDIGAHLETRPEGRIGVVASSVERGGVIYYRLNLPDGASRVVMEHSVRPAIITDPVAVLRAGMVQDTRSCNLRTVATRLLFAHQYEELSSLSDSRVEIKPHQVGVLHRVISSFPHRFLLADEVGLGKTVEAGLIIKELKTRGVATRVLIIAPSGIVSQWQFELKTKFNEIFSHYNSDVVRYLDGQHPGENVWTLNDNVIVSSSYAAWDERRRRDIALAGWDLVVVDEAHHARRYLSSPDRAQETNLYRLVEALSEPDTLQSRGMLLLTATPMQLHPYELYSLVELLDPSLFADYASFDEYRGVVGTLNRLVERLQRWEQLDRQEQAVTCEDYRALVGRLPELMATQSALESTTGRTVALAALQQAHRLSQVLIRNRKSVVGGFMPRLAVVWPVQLTPQEREAYDAVTDYARRGFARAQQRRDNAIGFLMIVLQRLNSSSSYALLETLRKRLAKLQQGLRRSGLDLEPDEADLEEKPLEEALDWALATAEEQDLAEEVQELKRLIHLVERIDLDSKARVLRERLQEMAAVERDIKVVIFTQFRGTQDYIQQVMPPGWGCNLFHGQLDALQKDAAVGRFRDSAGPQALISTEAGGEGRNLQFSHTLINFDLPWNPMKIEQRIGRVDRLGQKEPVKIINFSVEGTIEERILDVLGRRIRLFEETIGGLDPILGDVEQDIKRIYSLAQVEGERALARLERELERRVSEARETERRMADFIMDMKSFRQDEVHRLLEQRGTVDHDLLRRFVVAAFIELGGKIMDDTRLPGAYLLHLRGQFANEFPHLVKEGATRRVTFDPAIAIEQQDVEFLAFGHPIVDELVRWVRRRQYPGIVSSRLIRTDEHAPITGWLFIYVMEFEGVLPSKQLLPIFIDAEGGYDPALSSWLLDRAGLFKRELDDTVPSCDEAFDLAVAAAEATALDHLTERQAELSVDNSARLTQERDKLERLFAYRIGAAQKKLAMAERTLHSVSSSDDPEVQRIIPAWAKNVENARRIEETIHADRARRLAELARREEVSAQHELFAASYVRIAPSDRS